MLNYFNICFLKFDQSRGLEMTVDVTFFEYPYPLIIKNSLSIF